MADVPYDGIVKGYFQVDTLSDTLKNKFQQYKTLVQKPELTDDDFEKIAKLMLGELVESLKDKAIIMSYDESVPVYLAKKAFGSKKNARGLRDCVRRDVEEKLANAIVFNQDEEIKSLSLSVENDDIKIKIN